ncbi:MAG: IclR family transcriptional regulator [Microbacterium sp.]
MTKRGTLDLPVSGPEPQYPIESVDNALKIIHLLGSRSELRLTEVAEALGVASSTAHRLLAMLQYRGFVRQDAGTKAYRAGSALSTVSFSILQRFDVREAVRPLLARLNEEFQETVHLVALDGALVRFLDAIESPRAVRVASRLGQVMAANCTSSGKAMLAGLSSSEVHRIFPADQLDVVTDRSIGTRTGLERALEAVRDVGYATSNQESEEGVRSVAAAFPPGSLPMRLAVNVSVPADRMNKATEKRLGERLVTELCAHGAAMM